MSFDSRNLKLEILDIKLVGFFKTNYTNFRKFLHIFTVSVAEFDFNLCIYLFPFKLLNPVMHT